jgi:hypothetical protein
MDRAWARIESLLPAPGRGWRWRDHQQRLCGLLIIETLGPLLRLVDYRDNLYYLGGDAVGHDEGCMSHHKLTRVYDAAGPPF